MTVEQSMLLSFVQRKVLAFHPAQLSRTCSVQANCTGTVASEQIAVGSGPCPKVGAVYDYQRPPELKHLETGPEVVGLGESWLRNIRFFFSFHLGGQSQLFHMICVSGWCFGTMDFFIFPNTWDMLGFHGIYI